MNSNLLKLEIYEEENKFSLKFKDMIILNHSIGEPCIELSHNTPKIRMNPRFIAYYKIKNIRGFPEKIEQVRKLNDNEGITLTFGDLLILQIRIRDGRLHLIPKLTEKAKKITPSINHFTINIPANNDEAIYGCGEQFSYLNLRGKKVPLWTQEPGIVKKRSIYKFLADLAIGAGGDWWTTYYPQPTFISSNNYFTHIESYAFAEFDFSNEEKHTLNVNEIPKKIIIDVKETAIKTLESLTNYLGRQRPLPEWIMDGVVMGIIGGLDKNKENSIPSKIRRAKESNTKIAAIWAEDWTGLREYKAQTRLFWNWRYDPELYKDLPNYIKKLSEDGIRFMGYNNCFLMFEGEMYDYAAKHGYLIKNKEGEVYRLRMFSFYASMLDLTNPEAWNWFKSIIKANMIDIGLDGWMCDFAEYIPTDCVLHSKADPYIHHNEYPVLWAKINEEAVKESGRDKGENSIIFFSRSGNYGTTKYSPLIWSGDQIMTFWIDSGLAAQINSAISLGFVGVGQTHQDIAGEFGMLKFKRTKEFFMRGTEFAAFTCVMRTHEAKEHSGWTNDSDKETSEHFAKFSRIHSTLVPYLKNAIDEYCKTGLPVIRHPYLHYENETILHAKKPRLLQYQYLLGRDLFVAPVYQKKKTIRKLYLPTDNWIHLWSGEEFKGGFITVNAPLGEPPVFYRRDSQYTELFKKLITI